MIPSKLTKGDEVRIISPSRSMAILSEETVSLARRQFRALGMNVTFATHVEERDEFDSSSVASRLEDLHEAFSDKNVKAIFTTIGGFNSNQLLKEVNYRLIKKHPKILCGYSDITALCNAITAKTGLVTYSGPHFSTLGMKKGLEYTIKHFRACLMNKQPFDVLPSSAWSDDPWYKNQNRRTFVKNTGWTMIQNGKAKGTIVGGNLCTLNLLQGTEFMPSLKRVILFLEDDEMAKDLSAVEFDRNLQSLLHLSDARNIQGLVLGRFQTASKMTDEKIRKIVKTKKELRDIPVIANADFGHTTPHITFPIGGQARLVAKNDDVSLKILTH